MLPYRDGRITRIAIIVFFVLIIGYAYFEARGVLYGPSIAISGEVSEVSTAYISIQGKAERIAKLAMNGRPISVTEDGAFDEPYLLSPGLNRIMLDATDRYGRTTQQIVQVVYKPDPNLPLVPDERTSSSTTISPDSVSTTTKNP